MKSFFELKEITVTIKPTTSAHRTLFWFLYGIDPNRISMAVITETYWCLPSPFIPTFFGSAEGYREGKYLSEE